MGKDIKKGGAKPLFVSKCRYCGLTVPDSQLTYHINNECPKSPK